MRAVICQRPADDLSTTTLSEAPEPVPGPGEIRVLVKAASLNPVDWKLCAGVAPWWTGPHVVGLDAAGVVDALGDGVEGLSVGDRVAWHGDLNRQGVFADKALTVAHVVTRLPDAVGFEAAAALPCAALTAYQAIVRKMRLEPGQSIVVQGASGGVGGFGVQIARNLGAWVIALARPEKAARVRALGAEAVLDHRAPDLKQQVHALVPGGVDAMLEVVKAEDFDRSLELLHYNGQIATTDPLPDLSHVTPYTHAASIHEVALGGAYAHGHLPTQADFAAMGEVLVGWLAEGRLDPMIEAEIGLEEVPDWLGRLRRRAFDGKAVVRL